MIEVEGLESGDSPQETAEFRQIYPVARQREGTEGPYVLGHEIGSDFGKTVTGYMDLRNLLRGSQTVFGETNPQLEIKAP